MQAHGHHVGQGLGKHGQGTAVPILAGAGHSTMGLGFESNVAIQTVGIGFASVFL